MRKLVLGLGIFAVSAGCSELSEVSQEPLAVSLNSTVTADRLTKNTTEMTVRAFLPGEKANSRGAELVGAKCQLTSDEFSTSLTTPRVVILPTFKQRAEFANRGAPGAISITCRTPEASGSVLVTAQEKELAAVTGAGPAGFIIGIAVSGAIASSTPWSYPTAIGVTLKD